MKNLFYGLIICLLLGGCTTTNKELAYQWNRTDSVATSVLRTDSLVIRPFGFTYSNNLLITEDLSNQSKRFVGLEVVGDSVKLATRFLGVGRGKDEALSALIYPSDDNILMATNYNMVSIKDMYEISDNAKIADPKSYRKIDIPQGNEIWQISKIDNDNFLVTFAGYQHKSMFGVLNIPNQSIRELALNYPGENYEAPSHTLSTIFKGKLLKKPFEQQYLYSTDEGNCVMLLTVKDGEIIEYKEVYNTYPKYTLLNNGNDHKFIRENNIDGYKPTTTQNFIYLLNCFSDNPQGNVVEVFDWSGNPVRKIVLDRGVKRIAVNEDDSILYGLTTNEQDEDEIIKAVI